MASEASSRPVSTTMRADDPARTTRSTGESPSSPGSPRSSNTTSTGPAVSSASADATSITTLHSKPAARTTRESSAAISSSSSTMRMCWAIRARTDERTARLRAWNARVPSKRPGTVFPIQRSTRTPWRGPRTPSRGRWTLQENPAKAEAPMVPPTEPPPTKAELFPAALAGAPATDRAWAAPCAGSPGNWRTFRVRAAGHRPPAGRRLDSPGGGKNLRGHRHPRLHRWAPRRRGGHELPVGGDPRANFRLLHIEPALFAFLVNGALLLVSGQCFFSLLIREKPEDTAASTWRFTAFVASAAGHRGWQRPSMRTAGWRG